MEKKGVRLETKTERNAVNMCLFLAAGIQDKV
jgi:hypothetical protein